ncbi:hypothetical protein JFL43_09455 [Viridibacillus sp. YIM B01967]|uniref:YesK-like protein n=1 Tax=Viridibacillus soli TaxID=2798301 RepID=A0ABS1H6N5_9BACL|nr:YesK family protein [Viridibacillus soli]MBK3495079.1 hypothetical protein [Viridibacillus soli]
MMLLPLLYGIIAGVVLTLVVWILKKQGYSKATNVYTLATLVLGVLIVAYGYTVVRGFEGFAYFLLGTPIVLFSIITIIITTISNAKKHQSI